MKKSATKAPEETPAYVPSPEMIEKQRAFETTKRLAAELIASRPPIACEGRVPATVTGIETKKAVILNPCQGTRDQPIAITADGHYFPAARCGMCWTYTALIPAE